jgi:polyisoprenoid-binding protein YceI
MSCFRAMLPVQSTQLPAKDFVSPSVRPCASLFAFAPTTFPAIWPGIGGPSAVPSLWLTLCSRSIAFPPFASTLYERWLHSRPSSPVCSLFMSMPRFLLLLGLLLPLQAAETVLDFDPSRTEVNWTLGDVLHTVHGTFKLKRGMLRFDPDTGQASGEFVVDVPSGASGSGPRDRRMHKEILESQKYPEAIFTAGHYDGKTIHGSLLIHGSAHELNMDVHVDRQGDDYIATTHFSIPYVSWGMKNPSNFLLKVNDHVEVDIRTVARAAR